MKKTQNKTKGNGCKKISSYFKSKTTVLKKATSSQDNDIIVLDSDEEQSNLDYKEAMSKRKFENGESNISPPFKKSYLCKSSPVASTSATNSVVSIKSMKELLSPTALRAYNSLNQKVEKVLDEIEQNTHISEILHCKTPEKQKPISKKTPIKSIEKASVSNHRTPRKLFLQSPNKINEFNVDVLKKFVKVTPKKSNNTQCDEKKCAKVQVTNETTPKKHQIASSFSPTDKVKAQLDFSSCSEVINKEVATELEEPKENINLSDLIFDGSWDDDMFEDKKYTLDLSVSQHCQIINIERKKMEVILTVKSTHSDEQAVCRLKDIWFDTKLNINDTLNITAIKNQDNEWLVNNQNGILVYEPDFLISATSIANGVFCKRKVVFMERYRGFDPTNKHMIVGSMVHLLLQDVLMKKMHHLEEIQKYANALVKKSDYIADIYACGEPYDIIKQEFFAYVPKVYDFITNYIQKTQNIQARVKKDEWKGRISDIEDIEENIWCSSLGVKGKVDITIKNGDEVLPIEVKSGRATVSVEHRGQVLLYIMMMNKLGYKVSSGLLLYLKEGILKEVPPTASEKAGLIMLRNELAFYLTKRPKLVRDDSTKTTIEHPQLPEPIYNRFCGSCPYNVICVTHARYFKQDISHLKPLRTVCEEIGDAITPEHVDYFMKWSALLTVEMGAASGHKNLKEIFTVPPNERKKKGKCLINLQVKAVTKENNRLYIHTFKENSTRTDINFLSSGLADHTYVVVSSEDRPAIASGFITQISLNSVEVTLERDLTVKYKDKLFFIDSYDSTSLLTSSMASLGLILDTSEQGNKLRTIIIDRKPPTFQKTIPKTIALKAKPILKRLNLVQRRAVLKAIATEDYFLIKGMPGTGKTATMVALIELLVAIGKMVLITSHTHSAVDNVCLRLVKYGVNFMRLGNKNRINKDLWPFCEDKLTKNCSVPEELETVYNSMPVIAVTCLGASHSLLGRRKFDVCIVDESTQVVQCSVFRPIFSAKTFILIGDPDQLPAVIQNNDALKLGMDESLFERLNSEVSGVSLNINYRMNEPITALANALTYKGELVIGSEEISKATLQIPKIEALKNNAFNWVLQSLSTDLDMAVQFIDTGPTWNLSHKVHWSRVPGVDESEKYTNIYEAAIVFHLVDTLLKGGITANQIGVIATYRSQVAQLTTLLKNKIVEVNTVDQYQGKDKNVIIYSCSKSVDRGNDWSSNQFELLESKRRLNVAITRAKHKLIIIGDWSTLKHYSTFKAIRNNLEKNFMKLSECPGFSWTDILEPVPL